MLDPLLTSAIDEAFHALSLYNEKTQPNQVLADALKSMDVLDQKYKVQQLKALDMEDMVSYALSIHDLKSYCHGTTLWINFYRQRLMLSDFRVLNSIQHLLETRYADILQLDEATVDISDWFARLVFHVRSAVKLRVCLRANPSSFLPAGPSNLPVFREDDTEYDTRMHLPVAQDDALIRSYVSRLLHLWLGGSSSFLSQARVSLVRLFIEHLGTGCLLLPGVWDLYEDPPYWLFNPSCPRFVDAARQNLSFSPSYLDDLDSQLLGMTLCNSPVISQFVKLQSQYLDMRAATSAHGAARLAAQLQAAEMKKLLISITEDVQLQRCMKRDQAKAKAAATAKRKEDKARLLAGSSQHSAPILAPPSPIPSTSGSSSISNPHVSQNPPVHPPPPSNPSASGSSSLPTSSTSGRDPVVRAMTFLEDAYYVVTNDDKSTMNDAQEVIYNRGDHFQPIRELGPSRTIMRNYLTVDFAKKIEGFFSIQLFRCIHFNSGAFRDCPKNLRRAEFHTIGEYEAYLVALKQKFRGAKDGYFCNSAAHGSATNFRTLERYRDFWEVANRKDFSWPPDRNFATTYAFFKTYKPTKKVQKVVDGEIKTEPYNLWNGVGKLTRYMLVLDMWGAGLLDCPTLDDIATIAAELGLGACKGLKLLGYLTEDGRGEEARQAFRDFYNDVHDHLSDAQKENFQWNPVTTEHFLCKFTRMIDYYPVSSDVHFWK